MCTLLIGIKDLDILMATTHENAQALHHTLAKFGVPLQDVTPKDFENKELFFMIGAPPNRIDILMGIPGVDFSDHRWFWKLGFEAVMLTDTAFYRNPNYHGPGDTADTLDYGKMAQVVEGLVRAVGDLAGAQ